MSTAAQPPRRPPGELERTSSNLEHVAAELAPLIAAELAGHVEPALLDAQDAGRLLNVPASWVLAEARAERIPHVRLGRYVRFERAELEAWWRARGRGPRARTGSNPIPRRGERP